MILRKCGSRVLAVVLPQAHMAEWPQLDADLKKKQVRFAGFFFHSISCTPQFPGHAFHFQLISLDFAFKNIVHARVGFWRLSVHARSWMT